LLDERGNGILRLRDPALEVALRGCGAGWQSGRATAAAARSRASGRLGDAIAQLIYRISRDDGGWLMPNGSRRAQSGGERHSAWHRRNEMLQQIDQRGRANSGYGIL
jgi:hypothetical protein